MQNRCRRFQPEFGGLFEGKFEKHVDFQAKFEDTTLAESNMRVIDNLVDRYNFTEKL